MRTRARFFVAPSRDDAEIRLARKLATDAHARWLAQLVDAGDPRVDLDADDATYERRVAAWTRDQLGRAS